MKGLQLPGVLLACVGHQNDEEGDWVLVALPRARCLVPYSEPLPPLEREDNRRVLSHAWCHKQTWRLTSLVGLPRAQSRVLPNGPLALLRGMTTVGALVEVPLPKGIGSWDGEQRGHWVRVCAE